MRAGNSGTTPRKSIENCYDIAKLSIKEDGLYGILWSAAYGAVLSACQLTNEEADANPKEILRQRYLQLLESDEAVYALTLLIKAGSAAMQWEHDRRNAAGGN